MSETVQVPKGWESKKLSEVSNQITDGAHKTPTYVKEGIPFLRVTDIKNKDINWDTVKRIPKNEHEELIKRSKPEFEDILYSKNGTIGRSIVIGWKNEFSIFVSLALIKPKKDVLNPYFLKMFLDSNSAISQATRRSKTESVTNLHLEEIRDIIIPLPSLQIQKKIVQKLDDILGQLEEKKQEYFQLVNNQVENLKTLDKKITESIFLNQKKNDWNKKPFGELILESRNGISGPPNTDNNGVKRLGIETVTQSKYEKINVEHCKYFDTSKSEIEKYSVKKDDLFTCRQNGNKHFVGKFAIYKDDISPLIYSDSLIKFRINTEKILPDYIVFFMNSFSTRKQIDPFCKTQAGNYSINGTNLKKIMIDYPSDLEEQKKILEVSKSIQTQTQIFKQKINTFQELQENVSKNLNFIQSSILDTAFSGKLVK
tara:strand:+ start:249 stop:1529 length:1281 start_codon:yes stop_codon:yes gene_type:complete